MPRRLYREDAYLTRFTAKVVAAPPATRDAVEVELDRTAFYPTGGGQPHDTGLLAGCPVVDVREAGGGRIVHVLRAIAAPSGDVGGEVDWIRRFDHMQQHTGQHILSRAFVETAGAATTSFHLGDSLCTIDVALDAAGETIVRRAEALANEVVFGDAEVAVEHLDASQSPRLASDMNLKRELALEPGDPIRIIRIGGFDATPCGGTHVRRAGEVGVVAVRSWERFKGGTRVSFACGGRAVRLAAELAAVVDACVAKLSAQPAQLPAAVARLQDQLAQTRRTVRLLNEALVGAEAIARDASARSAGSCRVIVEVFPGRPIDDLQLLARKYVVSGSRVALLASSEPATGKATIVFARSDHGVPEDLVMGAILSEVCRSRGGKGGGGAALARGGGVAIAEAEACLEDAWRIVSSRLTS